MRASRRTLLTLLVLIMASPVQADSSTASSLPPADQEFLAGLIGRLLFDPRAAQRVQIKVEVAGPGPQSEKIDREGWLVNPQVGQPARIYFDETRPFGADENPLQARFLSFLRFAINNVRNGLVRRVSKVERRPKGTVSIIPGRQRHGDLSQGVSADELAARSSDRGLAELVEDITEMLAQKETKTGLPLVDLFREMMAGMRSEEQRKLFGDTKARKSRQIIVQTIEEYGRSTGNRALLRLLARFQGEEEEASVRQPTAVTPKTVLSDKEKDYASILDVMDKLGRAVGSADLGKYRRRWLGYPPRDSSSGYKNRLEEVLANMLNDQVIVARQTRGKAFQYSPGPNAGAYRRAEADE